MRVVKEGCYPLAREGVGIYIYIYIYIYCHMEPMKLENRVQKAVQTTSRSVHYTAISAKGHTTLSTICTLGY